MRHLLHLTFLIFSIMAAAALPAATKVTDDVDWWQNAVIYQIYPRSFMDSNGDGVGDLRGIISKLDYLAKLGIAATWLSPIFQSPMVDFGYDISNFTAIHDEYGSMQDFEDLVAEANKRDIKIILDFVPNHSSDQCEWFLKSVERVEGYEDFYIWADGKLDENNKRVPPNNWQSVFYGSAWTWNEKRKQYYLHQFAAQQPDLNYRNSKVIETMDQVLRFWLDKGVSGFRVDAVNHLFELEDLPDEPLSGFTTDSMSYDYTKHIYTRDLPEVYDMLHHWRRLLDDYTTKHGGHTRIMMTEAYAETKQLMSYYEDTAGNQGAHFPFNFMFIGDLNKDSDAHDFVFNIMKWLVHMPKGHVANWVLGNHDNPRVASRFGSQRVDAMNMLLMTLPGVAITYNGEELGMEDYRDISWEDTVDPPARNSNPEDYKKYSRDPERTPFQWNNSKNAGFSTAEKTWLPVHPNFKQLNWADQIVAAKSYYKVYERLVQLRKMPTLRKGRFQAEVLNRKVFAYKRELRGQPTVVVVINVGDTDQTVNLAELIDLPTQLVVLVAGSASSYENGETLSSAALKLEPYEGLICTYEYVAD